MKKPYTALVGAGLAVALELAGAPAAHAASGGGCGGWITTDSVGSQKVCISAAAPGIASVDGYFSAFNGHPSGCTYQLSLWKNGKIVTQGSRIACPKSGSVHPTFKRAGLSGEYGAQLVVRWNGGSRVSYAPIIKMP